MTVDCGAKRQRHWSCGFVCQIQKVNAHAHILFSLLVKSVVRTSESTIILMEAHNATTENPDAGSPPSAMIESKMLPLKLSFMDFL